MRIAVFGDVVGRPGRAAVMLTVGELRAELEEAGESLDLAIANIENAAHGFGITEDIVAEMTEAGVDLFSSGNHVWKNKRGEQLLTTEPEGVVVPYNYTDNRPGRGWTEINVNGTRVCLLNLLGEVFMHDAPVKSPFDAFDAWYGAHGEDAVVLVDLHAEVTGEKRAFGWYVDGRASAVWGTHTHIPTADEQILTEGTGYITDLGMCGAVKSSLGMDIEKVLQKVAKKEHVSLEPPREPEEMVARGILMTIDDETKQTTSIERIDRKAPFSYTNHK